MIVVFKSNMNEHIAVFEYVRQILKQFLLICCEMNILRKEVQTLCKERRQAIITMILFNKLIFC
jgi:hypothetical protein